MKQRFEQKAGILTFGIALILSLGGTALSAEPSHPNATNTNTTVPGRDKERIAQLGVGFGFGAGRGYRYPYSSSYFGIGRPYGSWNRYGYGIGMTRFGYPRYGRPAPRNMTRSGPGGLSYRAPGFYSDGQNQYSGGNFFENGGFTQVKPTSTQEPP